MMKLPPTPKWNPDTDDIDCSDFIHRCQDRLRSTLPPDLVFPKTGQVWEALEDCRVHVRKWVSPTRVAAFWPDALLERGERVVILELDHPQPLQVPFRPVSYEELHQVIAPGSLRYELRMATAATRPMLEKANCCFLEAFRLVQASPGT